MPAEEPGAVTGLLGSSFSRTRSFIQTGTLRSNLLNRRKSVHIPSEIRHRKSEPRLASTSSQSSAHVVAMKSPLSSKSRKGEKESRSKLKKGTILRAVPNATACAATPLLSSIIERDMATLPNQEVLDRISPRSPQNGDLQFSIPSQYYSSVHRTHTRTSSNSGTTLCTIPAGTEMQFPELKGTIGIYKHGRIEWGSRDDMAGKSRRPKIQVVIPNDQRNRPLPTSPFFRQGPFSVKTNSERTNSHIRSASAEYGFAHDISPPSGSRSTRTTDSVVSPLSAQQHYHHHHGLMHFRSLPAVRESPQKGGFLCATKSTNTAPSNSSDESPADDGSSVYSKRSSMSSMEANSPPPKFGHINLQERTVSEAFSIISPVKAGIFDSETPTTPHAKSQPRETGPQTSTRSQVARRYAPHPPIEEDVEFIPTCGLRPLRVSSNNHNLQRRPTATRKSSASRRGHRRSLSADPGMGVINEAIQRSSSAQQARNIPSPTLSEAENDLQQHLSTCQGAPTSKWSPASDDWETSPEMTVPPALPRKSSKRISTLRNREGNFRLSRVPGNHIVSQLKRNRSVAKSKGLTIDIPEKIRRTSEDLELSPIPLPAQPRAITPDTAENVILTILRNLETLDDLFATAIVNRGFYRVFKRHELELMKCILRRMSPPAWEHREICYPGHDEIANEEEDDLSALRRAHEYTPTTYFQYYTRDLYIIAALKSLIKQKCQSFLRSEMAVALASTEPLESARVDDALWRIWTFCKIFGSGKGREEDIVAQMDWLKGGVLVHQKTCTFSILTTESIDMNGMLASAPECFAKGNEGGLTAEELFDMMELWNCLGVLLQPFEGRTIQAREFGVYENTHIRGGDIDGEEMMLDEWYYYLLTLGLSPILDLSGPCSRPDSSGFLLASQNGWISNWNPPVFGGSRRNFLKEAASRVYEEKIAVTYAESSTKEMQRHMSKQRIQKHITELRQRKITAVESGRLLGPTRMSQERPISEWEDVIHNLTRPRPAPKTSSNLVSHIPTLRSTTSDPTLAEQLSVTPAPLPHLPLPPSRTPPPPPQANSAAIRSGPTRTVAQPLLPTPPPSTVSGDRRSSTAPSVIMPSITEHPVFRFPDSIPEMPALHEHPAFQAHAQPHRFPGSIPEMPALQEHPAFQQHVQAQQHSLAPSPYNRSSPPSSSHSHSHSHSSSSSHHHHQQHPAFTQHPLQSSIFGSNAAENTAEKAVFRIVEMGFTAEQARRALRVTDRGDGLRVDRAVEVLLRGEV